MTLALYRKYRPTTFAELVGQEHVTTALQQALRNDRVHHAYLFSGPRGCGKTSSARILARSLNCVDGPTPDPCGKCESCEALAPNGPGSLDVVEIDAASHGGVDDARDLRERAFFSPVSSRYKIYVVDEAHMVSREGFNALLKVVEEPPEFLKFVFATTEPDKVIATIKSRTHHYPFRLVPPRVLSEHLATICLREGVEIEPRAIPLVVRAGAGSVRDALSVLDQLIAGSGPDGVTYALALGLLGATDDALLDETLDAIAARDGAALFATVAAVVDAGHDPRRFAADLLDRLKDLIVLQRAPDAVERELVVAPPDRAPVLAQQAANLGAAELSRAADLLYAGLTEMRGAASPRLVLELVCARILLPGAATDDSAVFTRLDRLERRLDIAGGAPPAPQAVATAQPTPAPEASEPPAARPRRAAKQPDPASQPAEPAAVVPAPPASGELDAAAVRRVWGDVLEAVGRQKKTTKAVLADAQVVAVDARGLTMEFKHHFHAKSLADPANTETLRSALREVLGVDWEVRTVVREADGPARAPVDDFAPGDAPADADGAPPPNTDAAGEDPAVALLKAGLGGTVISQIEPD